MDYPARLLPQPHYRLIASTEGIATYFLQRSTPNKDIIDPDTLTVKPSYICFQTDHLADLSTNLLGVFTTTDHFFQIIGDRKGHFTSFYNVGETIETPRFPDDFLYDDKSGAIYISIKSIHGLEIPYNIGEETGFTAICKVLHTPVKANFWHFSLRWFNEEGDVLNQKGGWRKRMLTAARAALIELSQIDAPPPSPLSPDLYMDGN